MTTTSTRTATIFDTFATRDDYLGFGYIGERARALESVASGEWAAKMAQSIDEADAYVLAAATTLTDEALFTWANSKDGRWFADCAFGAGDLDMARRYGPRA